MVYCLCSNWSRQMPAFMHTYSALRARRLRVLITAAHLHSSAAGICLRRPPHPLAVTLVISSRAFSSSCVSRAVRESTKSLVDAIETNVSRDVLLYHKDNRRFCMLINLFAVAQLVMWWLFIDMVRSLKDVEVPHDLPASARWYERINFGSPEIRRGTIKTCTMFGLAMAGLSVMFSLRCVNRVVLLKGGERVTFFTYSPLFQRSFTVPVESVSSRMARVGANTFIPLKVRRVPFVFIVDSSGHFPNPSLYDWTIGCKRAWQK